MSTFFEKGDRDKLVDEKEKSLSCVIWSLKFICLRNHMPDDFAFDNQKKVFKLVNEKSSYSQICNYLLAFIVQTEK